MIICCVEACHYGLIRSNGTCKIGTVADSGVGVKKSYLHKIKDLDNKSGIQNHRLRYVVKSYTKAKI
jgi:hypothetical protein